MVKVWMIWGYPQFRKHPYESLNIQMLMAYLVLSIFIHTHILAMVEKLFVFPENGLVINPFIELFIGIHIPSVRIPQHGMDTVLTRAHIFSVSENAVVSHFFFGETYYKNQRI